MVFEIKTLDDFEKAMASDFALIDFYGVFCQPCMKLMPYISECEKKFPHVKFYKVDVENPELEHVIETYEVEKIPRFFVIKNSKKISDFTGSKLENIIFHLNEL